MSIEQRQNSGIDFRFYWPSNPKDKLQTRFELLDRAKKLQFVRQTRTREILGPFRGFPELENIEANLRLFNELAPFIDQAFVAQFIGFDKAPLAIEKYAPDASRNLKSKIRYVLDSEKLSRFRNDHPETIETLEIVAEELISEDDPTKLKTISKKLKDLSTKAYRSGRVVWLFSQDQSYTREEDAPSEDPKILEMDLRLFVPIPNGDVEKVRLIAEDVWSRLSHLDDSTLETPLSMVGRTLGVAGSQIFSSTSAEQVNQQAIVILVDQFKYDQAAQKISELLNDTSGDPLLIYRILQYLAHEYAHIVWNKKFKPGKLNGRYEEVAVDISSVKVVLEMFLNHVSSLGGLELEKFIQALLSEAYGQAIETPTDGYVLSGKFMVNALSDYQLVGVDTAQRSLTLNLETTMVQRFIDELNNLEREIYQENLQTLESLEEKGALQSELLHALVEV